MVITVSDIDGIKQYNAPENIKRLFIYAVSLFLVLLIGLIYYIISINIQVSDLEQSNDMLSEQIIVSDNIEETLNEVEKELTDAINYKLSLKDKYEKEKLALKEQLNKQIEKLTLENNKIKNDKQLTLKEKNETDKLLEELTKEIKDIESELEEEVKIKEKLRKKLSLRKKRKKDAIKKEKKRKQRLAKRKHKRENLLKRVAKAKLGKKYVWGAVGPRTFDCSGFTSYVYKKTGVRIPRRAIQQSKYGKLVKRKSLKPGDLIFFDTSKERKGYVNHVGIYLGNNKFIHASSAKKKVVVTSLNKAFYSNRYKCARRITH